MWHVVCATGATVRPGRFVGRGRGKEWCRRGVSSGGGGSLYRRAPPSMGRACGEYFSSTNLSVEPRTLNLDPWNSQSQPWTLNLVLRTLRLENLISFAPSTLDHHSILFAPSILNFQPSVLNLQSWTFNLEPWTWNLEPSALIEPWTLNLQAFNLEPWTLRPSILYFGPLNLEPLPKSKLDVVCPCDNVAMQQTCMTMDWCCLIMPDRRALYLWLCNVYVYNMSV